MQLCPLVRKRARIASIRVAHTGDFGRVFEMDSEGNPITKDTLVSKLPFQNAQKLIYDSIALSQLDETKLISVLTQNTG